MRTTRRRQPLITVAGLCCFTLPLSAAETPSPQSPATFALLQQTVRDRIVFRRSSYNYAPAVIHDGTAYHLYWCGGVAGDFILHAQAAALEGPWHAAFDLAPSTFDVALAPTKSPANFDGLHVCDPNVVKIQSRYFLYYSGASSDGALTAIGVAVSTDGVHFDRLNGGGPIVTPAKTNSSFAADHLTYGAGQPAVVYIAPYVYLAFTDSTGAGVNMGNGAGQFALRSLDPSFATNVQELTASGWQARPAGRHTAEYSFLESFGMDWSYDRRTQTLIAVSDRVAQHATLFALDPETLGTIATGDLALNWREGPALLSEADKSTAPRADCNRLDIAVFAAEGSSASPWTWNTLGYSSGKFSLGSLCPPR